MNAPSEEATPRLLVCACAGSDCLSDEKRQAILGALPPGTEGRVEWVPDLCRIAARDPERLQDWTKEEEAVTVVACYPRTVHALFEWAGVENAREKIDVLNLRTQDSDEVLKKAGLEPGAGDERTVAVQEDDWVPWYPVIDPDRCVDCKQCMNFCLFGVYGEDEEGRVDVVEPESCKTNCPACARICPQAAIIFPKYPHSPINGEQVGELGAEKEKIKVDMDKLIQGNVHAALAARKFKRQRMALLRKEKGGAR